MQSTAMSSASIPSSQDQSPDTKILHDLSSVTTQISLLTSMLHALPRPFTPSSISSDTSLLTVLGFLEACVPRMVDLIQAGSGGMIGEETLVKTLEVNDELCRVLKDVEDPTGLWEREAGKNSGGSRGLEAKFDAFGLDSGGNGGGGSRLSTQNSGLEDLLGETTAAAAEVGRGKAQSSTLDDLLAMSSDNKVTAAEASDHVDNNGGGDDEDDFDNFFGERMEGKI